MKRQHEQLLVATLAAAIILSGAIFAVQPSMAAHAGLGAFARAGGVDQPSLRFAREAAVVASTLPAEAPVSPPILWAAKSLLA